MSEALASPEQTTNTYTTTDVVSLVVNSFRFSRANGRLQKALLSFIGTHYRDRFGDDFDFDAALEPAQAAAYSIYSRTHLGPSEQVTDQMQTTPQKNLDERRNTVNGEVSKYMDTLKGVVDEGSAAMDYLPLEDLAAGIVAVDSAWIERQQTRETPHRSSAVRSFSSNFITYGLLGRPTGRHEQEFDAAYQAATELILHQPDRVWHEDPAAGPTQIREIIDNYVAAHPTDGPAVSSAIAGTPLEALLPASIPIA